jgi:hypothetical protein
MLAVVAEEREVQAELLVLVVLAVVEQVVQLLALGRLARLTLAVEVVVAQQVADQVVLAVRASSSFAIQTHSSLQHLQLAHPQLQRRMVLEFISGRVQARSRSNHGYH